MAVKGKEIAFCQECEVGGSDTCKAESTCKEHKFTKGDVVNVMYACIPDKEDEAKKCDENGMIRMRPTLMMALFVIAVCIGLN